jgi:cell division GTPase FtsZ
MSEDLDMGDFMDAGLVSGDSREIEDAKSYGLKFGFIGAGQAGCNLVSTLWDKFGYRRTVLFNTTHKDLQFTPIPASNHVVPTGFDGAGKDRTRGREAAEQSRADVAASLQARFQTVDFIYVVTSAGGGSGSGSAPVLAEVAFQHLKQLGLEAEEAKRRVGFIVMLPTNSDGSAVSANAGALLDEITIDGKSKYGPMLLIDNERIKRLSKGTLADWQEKSNTWAARLFSLFNSMAGRDSRLATFDPTDYKSVLTSGILTIGMNYLAQGIETPTTISSKLNADLRGNLLVDGLNLTTGTHAAILIISDERSLSSEFSDEALEKGQQTLLSLLGNGSDKHVVLHRGIYSMTNPGLFVYSIIGGLTIPPTKFRQYRG